MCNRFTIRANAQQLAAQFLAEPQPDHPIKEGQIWPTDPAPCVRLTNDGKRELVGLRWWLVPEKSQGIQNKYPMFNARAETVAEKQSYRDPFRHRRCLLLTTGWIEGKGSEKHIMRRTDKEPFALAGLWDRWQGGGQVIESCTMLMMETAPSLASIHDRMPIILPPFSYDAWLDPELTSTDAIMSLLTTSLDDITAEPVEEAKS